MASLLEQAGSQPQKQPKYALLFSDRLFTGIYTQRSPLHDPSDIITFKYYGGRMDALWAGANIELNNDLNLQRRPGLVEFSSFVYPTQPLTSYSFELINGTIRVMVDTGSTGPSEQDAVTSVAASTPNGQAVYTGTFASGANNGLQGQFITIAGFVNSSNNGQFVVYQSTATTLTLLNASAIAETASATATTIYFTSMTMSGTSMVLSGIVSGGAGNAYAGLVFNIAGFVHGVNNGPFTAQASTSTTLTLYNPYGVSETGVTVTAVSAGAVYWDEQNGSATLIWPKSPGAGQTHFINSGGILFFGDGVDTKKWTPLNSNTPPGYAVSVWNWGIVAPSSQPSVNIVSSGSAATQWQASTVFSTMGITYDATNNQVWQLIGVDASPLTDPNVTNAQFGTSGSGGPDWDNTVNGSETAYGLTTDNTIVWKNVSWIQQWAPGAIYGDAGVAGTASNICIYDPETNALYLNFNGGGGLSRSGSLKPPFTAVVGWNYTETHGAGGSPFNEPHWFFFCTYSQAQAWAPSTVYPAWYSAHGGSNKVAASIIEPFILPPPTTGIDGNPPTPVFLQINNGASGTSGSTYIPFPSVPTSIGQQVIDNQLLWQCISSATGSGSALSASWKANFAFVPWTVSGGTFACIFDGTNLQVCTSSTGSGLSGGSTPSWGTTYGANTNDGGLVWVCIGKPYAWSATTVWNLPLTGFAPPQQTQKYGGSTIDASNGTVQTVIQSGLSGASAPSWGTVGNDTTDGTSSPQLVWYAESLSSTNSLSFSKGYSYAYSYKARPLDDIYSAPPLGGINGVQQIPPGQTAYLTTPPPGSQTNAVSSASPANTQTGSNSGAVIYVSGQYSSDPQVDTIIIWRSTDGGGPDQMFELTEINNVVGGGTWTFADFLPDAPTSQYPGLNTEIPAPINGVNNPPTSTFLPQDYYLDRIWGADGQYMAFSGGPDTLVGNPDEAYAISDAIPFLATVTRAIKSSQCLFVFLTDSIQAVIGGPATSTLSSVPVAPGVGLLSWNALDQFAGEIYFFSADNQFRVITPSLNITNAGFPLGDQFANLPTAGVMSSGLNMTWDASQVYVASYQNGNDNCIMVADGNTGWYRLNPRQAGAFPTPEPVWSPYAIITNGCQMVNAIKTAPGISQLLVGSQIPGEPILSRNLSVFTDNGTEYDAFFEMGNIVLAHQGQIAALKFVAADFSGEEFQPTISYLLNEIAGDFTEFSPEAYVFDPPFLYGGRNIVPESYSPNRYYFASTASLARCRHIRLRIDFGKTSVGDEIFNIGIYGKILVER